MRRFILFTLLYLAAGICLTAIALQSPDLALRSKVGLLTNAGRLYLCSVLSTFSFWHENILRQNNRPDQTNQFGDRSPVEVNATAKYEGSPGRFVIVARTSTGHTQRYEFERVQVIQ